MVNRYLTKDLYEASALCALGCKLIELKNEGKFYWFIFEGSDCQKLASQYWTEEISVNAKRYADAIRTLKDRIFAQK